MAQKPMTKKTPKQKSKKAKPATQIQGLDTERLQQAYELMLLIRRFEERAGQLYGLGKIGGFCHLYSGQEAVVAGIQAARQPGDQMITAYRDHGHIIASGVDPIAVMAELLGRAQGTSKGKGGSMHMFDVAGHFLWRTWHCRCASANWYRSSTCQSILGSGKCFIHLFW